MANIPEFNEKFSLYELCKRKEGLDLDTYDNIYDATVTVCVDFYDLEGDPDDEDFDYFRFIREIMKRVEVIDENTVAWSTLVENNVGIFRRWTEKHWYKGNHEYDDDYIYEWVGQIHLLFAGYGTDDIYKSLCDDLLAEIPEIDRG